MGLGMTASAPCLVRVLRVCSFVLFTIWVTPENQLAKLALRGSSVLPQDFRGLQMECNRRFSDPVQVTCINRLTVNATPASGVLPPRSSASLLVGSGHVRP